MKKILRKYLVLLMIAVLCLSSVGCGKDKDEDASDPATTQEEGVPADVDTAVNTDLLEAAVQFAPNTPMITAKSVVLVEQSTGTILYEKGLKEKMYPASMTKMLTALIVLDYFSADELVKVGTEINEVSWDSSKAGHLVGETLTIENLIRGLIIPSGNDSANVAAAVVAQRAQNDSNLTFSQSQTVFAELMNEKATELGAQNSHFTNAHGYHDENHYSCAYDMALFALEYMKNPTLATIASERSYAGNGADNMFTPEEGVLTMDYAWRSHNLLITDNEYQYDNAIGIKTGFTNEAGDCLATAAQKDGKTLIAIIFGAEDPSRWTEGKALFEYGFNQYEEVQLLSASGTLEAVPLAKQNKLEGSSADVTVSGGISVYLPTGMKDRVTFTTSYLDDYKVETKDGEIKLNAPFEKGTQLGAVTYTVDGKTIVQANVIAKDDVAKWTVWSNIKYFFKNFGAIVFTTTGLIGLVVVIAIVVVVLVLRKRSARRRKRKNVGYSFRTPSSGLKHKSIGKSKSRRNNRRRRF